MSSQSQTALLDRFEQTVGEVGLLEAGEQITVLDAMISRLQARQADAARRLEADGGLDGSGCKTVGSWLRLRLRRDAGAHRIARRAKMLVELPNVAAAFGAGQINDEHVDTLIAGMKWCGREAIVRHEQTLLQLCRDASAKELRQALEELAELEDPDRDEQRVKAHGERFFTLRRVGDLIHVDAMVEPSIGEALKTAVEAGAAPVAGDGRSLAQRRADAFAELVLRGIGADTDP
ncbi:MAG: 13E12 repeat family protein, partial [Actinomycetota bacterium]|nr:13E12 repeat family protein [Actinomycetota bacterium]